MAKRSLTYMGDWSVLDISLKMTEVRPWKNTFYKPPKKIVDDMSAETVLKMMVVR